MEMEDLLETYREITPEYLDDVELAYELRIRGVEKVTDRREMLKVLNQLLKENQERITEASFGTWTERELQDELQICQDLANKLALDVDGAQPGAVPRVLKARCTHLLMRVLRNKSYFPDRSEFGKLANLFSPTYQRLLEMELLDYFPEELEADADGPQTMGHGAEQMKAPGAILYGNRDPIGCERTQLSLGLGCPEARSTPSGPDHRGLGVAPSNHFGWNAKQGGGTFAQGQARNYLGEGARPKEYSMISTDLLGQECNPKGQRNQATYVVEQERNNGITSLNRTGSESPLQAIQHQLSLLAEEVQRLTAKQAMRQDIQRNNVAAVPLRSERRLESTFLGAPVHKWSIGRFGGQAGEWPRFVAKLEMMARTQGATEDVLFANRVLLFEGDVLDLVLNSDARTWTELKEEIATLIYGANEDYDRWKVIEQSRQGKESCTVFLNRLALQFQSLRVPPSEELKVRFALKGLRVEIGNALVADWTIGTMAMLRKAAARVEAIFKSREMPLSHARSTEVLAAWTNFDRANGSWSNRNYPASSGQPNRHWETSNHRMANMGNTVERVSFCYRCGQAGHLRRGCLNPPKIICTSCGRDGKQLHEWPHCSGSQNTNSGN